MAPFTSSSSIDQPTTVVTSQLSGTPDEPNASLVSGVGGGEDVTSVDGGWSSVASDSVFTSQPENGAPIITGTVPIVNFLPPLSTLQQFRQEEIPKQAPDPNEELFVDDCSVGNILGVYPIDQYKKNNTSKDRSDADGIAVATPVSKGPSSWLASVPRHIRLIVVLSLFVILCALLSITFSAIQREDTKESSTSSTGASSLTTDERNEFLINAEFQSSNGDGTSDPQATATAQQTSSSFDTPFPSENPSRAPSRLPSVAPSAQPSKLPSARPSWRPSARPSAYARTAGLTLDSSSAPSYVPSWQPSAPRGMMGKKSSGEMDEGDDDRR